MNGDVVVDDRLFTPHKCPDGLISPIWVNENLIDIEVTPGAGGRPGDDDRLAPEDRFLHRGDPGHHGRRQARPPRSTVTEPTPGHLVVTGQIAAGNTPTLVVKEITDPSAFARTAFIEALQRAGVTVTAAPTGPNPAALLPAKDSYQAADKLGEHVSATLAAYVKLIMKVSYNRGADLMTCLAAVKTGSTDCEQGLVAEVDTATAPRRGEGRRCSRSTAPARTTRAGVTATALATFYKQAAQAPYATALVDSLPILGKDGTLANVLPDSPAAGKAQIEDRQPRRRARRPARSSCSATASPATSKAKSGRQLTVHGRRGQHADRHARRVRDRSPRTRRRWSSPSNKPSDAPVRQHQHGDGGGRSGRGRGATR